MATTTPNLGLTKPTVGADADAWGGQLNASLDTLDLKVLDKTTGGTVTGPLSVTGALSGNTVSGNGAALTNLNASNLASGTVPDARFPATLPAISGANLTNLNASNLASGTVPSARLTGSYAISITGNAATATSATTATNQSGGTVNATSISGTSINVSGTSSLSGRTVSDAADANTIVTRDGNNYSFFNYINSNTGNSENPGVSQVIVTNGGDGFFRKASIGHLTASLSGTAPINITGNAATATSATTAGNGGVTSVNGRTGAVSVSENNPDAKVVYVWQETANALGTTIASRNLSSVTRTAVAGDAIVYQLNYASPVSGIQFPFGSTNGTISAGQATGDDANYQVAWRGSSGTGTYTTTSGTVVFVIHASSAFRHGTPTGIHRLGRVAIHTV